ncbi:MAG: nicotinamide riboside transporter PnuC [Clostridia bacterium]
MKENTNEKKFSLKKLWQFFTTYEKIWFFSLLSVGLTLAFVIPDEDVEGKTLLLVCSLIALVAGLLCELLISKQSRWNFLVSFFFVEVTEIIICLSLGYYASAGVTLVFWIPIDFISFFQWTKNKDEIKTELTKVRKFTFKQDILILLAIGAFAVIVGYVLQFIGGEDTYLDALTSAFGIANGLLIYFRYREQWTAWYLYTIFEAILWILSGQWIMLVLTLGYLTNTTYGLIRWNNYIKSKQAEKNETESINLETKSIQIKEQINM